jgi:protocatechuate 3,4-dioxygenase beta subunit
MARKVLVVSVALFAALIAAVVDFGDPPTRSGSVALAPEPVQRDRPAPPTLAAPIEPGDLRLEGIVVDRDEHPVGGVLVTLAGARETVTEADGSFAFEHLATGNYVIAAEQGSAYAEDRGAKLTATSDPVTLTLRRGAALIVHVVAAESGEPIANAKVETSDRAGLTDSSGTVALRALDTGSTRIEVVAAGRAPITQYVSSDDPELAIERTIELAQGAPLSGVVLDELGKPLANASVNVDTITTSSHLWVTTDDDGRWSLAAVAGGKHAIQAIATHHISAAELVVETDGAHARTDIVVRVDRGGAIAGIVVDRRGARVANASVSTGFGHATTDDAGAFRVDGIPPGDYSVSATTATAGTGEHAIRLGPGDAAQVELVLGEGSIAGRVVDDAGHPVADASLRARHARNDHLYHAFADDYGKFDFGGMEPGDYKITIGRRDVTYADDLAPRVVKTGERNARFVIPQPIAITGRVVLDGKPLTSYGVVISTDPDPRYSDPTPVRDPNGRFARTDIGPGTWAVTIVGRDIAKKTITDVKLTASRIDLGDITVERGRVISGRVVDDRGRPIGDARVEVAAGTFGDDETLERLLRGEVFGRSAADGTFRLAGVPGGTLELRASHPTHGTAVPHAIAAGESSATLVLFSTGVLDGTIASYSDLANEVVIRDAATGIDIAKSDLDRAGTFHFGRLPAGERIVVLRGGEDLQAQHVTIRPGVRSRVSFTLPKQPITLKLDREGCAQITLRDAVTRSPIATVSCEDGRGEITNVSPGRYLACADSGACKPIEVLTWVTIQIFDI